MRHVAQKIKMYRKAKGLTILEMCFRAQLSQTCIFKAEKYGNMTLKTLNKIADALEVPIADLLQCEEGEAA